MLYANSYIFRHHVLELRSFVVNKLPEDGTQVPQHVGAVT